ncbi:YunG family protein [Micromonospora haikouensis]|uniref:YunG family protein n=1 Tax=Micromonospora haikouensis TaxID=686309 RepID=UPI0037AFD82E
MHDVDVLRPILRASWGADTCDPHDLPDWRPDNAARGQCGVTALVVQDLLGGELVLGEVFANGTRTGHHYWNRLPDGRHIDLTADQFRPDEAVVGGRVQQRPPGAPRRCRAQYETLRQRVLAELSSRSSPPDGHRRGPVEGEPPPVGRSPDRGAGWRAG